jgi:LacI family transcriptional regulator
VTLRDVAEASGFGLGTVSAALAGSPVVKADTRARINVAAAELGYRVSGLGRALRTGRTNAVGIVVPDISNPVITHIVRGIGDTLLSRGMVGVVCNTDDDLEKQVLSLTALLSGGVDGLLFVSQTAEAPIVRQMLRDGPPCVFINRRPLRRSVDYVGVDNEGGVGLAVDHLVGHGHRRIAMLHGPLTTSTAMERAQGYRQAMLRHGLRVTPDLEREGDYRLHTGTALTRDLLVGDDPPSAIIAANDLMAVGALTAIRQHGLTVPDDRSVVGFGDTYLAHLPPIDLTTIYHATPEMGASAVDMLLRRIAGQSVTRRSVVLPTRLVVRGSTADCPHRAGAARPEPRRPPVPLRA